MWELTRFNLGCVACWCPCLTYAQNKSRLEYLERSGGAPHPEGGEMINTDTIIFGAVHCITGFGWLLQVCRHHDG